MIRTKIFARAGPHCENPLLNGRRIDCMLYAYHSKCIARALELATG